MDDIRVIVLGRSLMKNVLLILAVCLVLGMLADTAQAQCRGYGGGYYGGGYHGGYHGGYYGGGGGYYARPAIYVAPVYGRSYSTFYRGVPYYGGYRSYYGGYGGYGRRYYGGRGFVSVGFGF
jgi:hypothetical protein